MPAMIYHARSVPSVRQGRHLLQTLRAGLALLEPTLLLQDAFHPLSLLSFRYFCCGSPPTPFIYFWIKSQHNLSVTCPPPHLLLFPFLLLTHFIFNQPDSMLLEFTRLHVWRLKPCCGFVSAGGIVCTPCSPGFFSTSNGDI